MRQAPPACTALGRPAGRAVREGSRLCGICICVCFNMQVPQATQLYDSCGCSAKSAVLLRTLEKGARKAGLGQ